MRESFLNRQNRKVKSLYNKREKFIKDMFEIVEMEDENGNMVRVRKPKVVKHEDINAMLIDISRSRHLIEDNTRRLKEMGYTDKRIDDEIKVISQVLHEEV